MEGEVKLTIKIDKKDMEYVIYNPKHIPHKGECISFSHIKDYDDEDDDCCIALPFEVDFVDYEYNIEKNTLNILILLE